MTKGIVDNKTKLITMIYNGQEVSSNSHVVEIIPCPACKGNLGYIVKPIKKENKSWKKKKKNAR